MFTVYFLRSLTNPTKTYRGYTGREHPDQRLEEHNSGKNASTAAHAPWELIASISFKEEAKARAFEAYTKHGSGHAFATRHIFAKN